MKKFLFIAFVLIIGTSIFMNAYSQQLHSRVLDMTVEANRSEDFVTVNRLYTWVHNSEPIATFGDEDEPQVILFESSVVHTVDGVEIFVPTISVIVRNLYGFPLTVRAGQEGGNRSRIVLERSGTEDFEVNFVVTGQPNTNEEAPRFVDLERNRDFVQMVRSVNFMHFSIRTEDITNDGEFNILEGLRLYDANNTDWSLDGQINYNLSGSEFFAAIDELNEGRAETGANRNAVLEQWMQEHSDLFDTEWYLGLSTSDILTFGAWMRIILEVGMYVLLFGVLGFFLFRKKKDPRGELLASNPSKK